MQISQVEFKHFLPNRGHIIHSIVLLRVLKFATNEEQPTGRLSWNHMFSSNVHMFESRAPPRNMELVMCTLPSCSNLFRQLSGHITFPDFPQIHPMALPNFAKLYQHSSFANNQTFHAETLFIL